MRPLPWGPPIDRRLVLIDLRKNVVTVIGNNLKCGKLLFSDLFGWWGFVFSKYFVSYAEFK